MAKEDDDKNTGPTEDQAKATLKGLIRETLDEWHKETQPKNRTSQGEGQQESSIVSAFTSLFGKH